jgi:hypothetical protein
MNDRRRRAFIEVFDELACFVATGLGMFVCLFVLILSAHSIVLVHVLYAL